MEIRDKLILISGASSGIGAAAARAMAREGGRMLLLARNRAALDQVAAEIAGGGGQAWVYPIDLADLEAVRSTAARIEREAGRPDILVNNAGAGRFLFVDETAPADAVEMMAVPYFAGFALTRAFLPGMLRRGSGWIVNLTSPAAYFPWPGAAAYSAARWAMRGFTYALRSDLHGTGIGATLIVPGKVSSAYFENNPGSEERLPGAGRYIPTLTPGQVAQAIVEAVKKERSEVILPLSLRLMILAHRFLPGLVEGMVIRSGARRG